MRLKKSTEPLSPPLNVCLVHAGAGHLRQQLAALRQQSQEQHRASRREVVNLREQLQQARQDRDQALAQVHRLGDTVEAAAAAKVARCFTARAKFKHVLF